MAENLEEITIDEARIRIREEMKYFTDPVRESMILTAEDYNWRANC